MVGAAVILVALHPWVNLVVGMGWATTLVPRISQETTGPMAEKKLTQALVLGSPMWDCGLLTFD